MLKKLSLLAFLVFQFHVNCIAQTRKVSAVEIAIPTLNLMDFTRDPNFLVNDGKVYRCVFKQNDTYFVERYALEQKKYSKLEVILPDELHTYLNSLTRYIFSYALDLNFLYVGIANTYIKFRIEEDSVIYIEKLDLSGKARGRYFDVDGDRLYIYQTYNHAKEDCSFLQIFSWSQKKELSYTKLAYEFPQSTHIGSGKNYIDFGKSCYLASQGIAYEVAIYNYDHTRIESIILEDESHFPLLTKSDLEPFNNQKSVAMRPMNYINDLMDLGKKGSRIWGANFVHDSLIVVNYSVPDTAKEMVFKDDIWLKKKGVWNLVETIDLYPAPETSVNEKTFWRFYLNNSANVFHEGKLYYILFNSASQLFDLTLKEFSAYTQIHETQLKIYTIDFNE